MLQSPLNLKTSLQLQWFEARMVAFMQNDLKVLDELYQDAIISSLLTSLQVHKVGKRHQEIKFAPPNSINYLGLFPREAA